MGGSCFEAGSGVVFYKDDFHKAKLTSEGVSLIDQMGEFYIVRFFESLPRGFQDIAIDANGRGIEAGDRVTYVAGGRNTPLDYGFSVGVDYIVNSIQTENIDFIPSISVIGGESLLVPSNRFVLNAKKQFA